jgi:hypothetical protein
MARTQDYMAALDSRIEIAPANSEEELAAAAYLEELCQRRGLDVAMEEFDCPKNTGLVTGILLILPIVGMILAGIPGIGMSVLGLVVMAVGLVGLYLMTKKGSPLEKICGTARSQNVVAFHKGVGPKSGKGVRPIVVLAHYDTGREDILAKEPVSRYARFVYQFAPYGLMVGALMCILELIVVLPTVLLVIFYIIGIIACIPALVWGVQKICSKFLPLVPSANDNQSGLACMFDVMDAVATQEGDDVVEVDSPVDLSDAWEAMSEVDVEEGEELADEIAEDVAEAVEEVVSNEKAHKGVWHGEEFIRSVGILPETCEITYVVPRTEDTARMKPIAVEEEIDEADSTADLGHIGRHSIDAEYIGEEPSESDRQQYNPMDAIKSTFGNFKNFASKAMNKNRALEDVPEIPHSEEGIHAAEEERHARAQQDPASTQEMVMEQFNLTTPSEPGEETWGVNEYNPSSANRNASVRRVALFDLPDPNENSVDPLAPERPVEKDISNADTAAYQPTQMPNADIETISSNDAVAPVPLQVLRGDKKSKGSKGWKGGAAKSGELRDSDYDLDVVEMQEEVMEFGDEDLLAHDIWFVATGASTLGFAGSKDFLERHRKQLRGALVFTITGVGAGTVSILTTEGSIEKRRVDRRILRTLKGVSKDLHVDVDEVPRPWADTDATPFMRNSIRSASIVGLEAGDVIAYAHTQEDVIENINPRQITQVAQLITEAIRRS